jgi:hypothetical protein
MEDRYDRIIYVGGGRYSFDREEGFKRSKVNKVQRRVIIDGLLNADVREVRWKRKRIYYYYRDGRYKYFLYNELITNH